MNREIRKVATEIWSVSRQTAQATRVSGSSNGAAPITFEVAMDMARNMVEVVSTISSDPAFEE